MVNLSLELTSQMPPPHARLDFSPRYNYCSHMTMKTKVRRIGNSLGIVLPKEALQAMRVKEGESVYLTEGPESSLNVTPEEPGFEEKAKIAKDLMHRYRNALRELAK